MKEKIKETFSKRLLETLEKRKMTQVELANTLGIAKASVNQYIKGKTLPKAEYLEKIANILGVSQAWLYGFDEECETKVSKEASKKERRQQIAKKFLEETTNVKVIELNENSKNDLESISMKVELQDETNKSRIFEVNGITFDVTDEEYEEFVNEMVKSCQEIIKEMVNNKMNI